MNVCIVGGIKNGASTFQSLTASYPSLLPSPKSISMNELYGSYDLQTMEWTDGVLSSVFRMFARDDRSDEKWLVLDGPVDTLWIESMNSA